jgi:hypothetical protein
MFVLKGIMNYRSNLNFDDNTFLNSEENQLIESHLQKMILSGLAKNLTYFEESKNNNTVGTEFVFLDKEAADQFKKILNDNITLFHKKNNIKFYFGSKIEEITEEEYFVKFQKYFDNLEDHLHDEDIHKNNV